MKETNMEHWSVEDLRKLKVEGGVADETNN